MLDDKNAGVKQSFTNQPNRIFNQAPLKKQIKYELTVGGIRDPIKQHTNGQGTHRMAVETFVKNIIQACLSRIVATGEMISLREIGRLIDTHKNQVSTVCTNVASLMADDVPLTPLKRERRKLLSD